MTTIPKRVLDLLEFQGFYELYVSMTKYCDTCKMAYDATEKEYRLNYGKNKYSSYESFRSAMSKNMKK